MELKNYVSPPIDSKWSVKIQSLLTTQNMSSTHWAASYSDDEKLLEKWIWGLNDFGHSVLVKAAIAVAYPTLGIWNGDLSWNPPKINEIVEAVRSQSIEHPQLQIEAAMAWLRSPSKSLAEAADATLGEFANRQQELWEPEFKYLWDEPSLWAIQSAEACAVSVNYPQPHIMAGIAAVATMKAVHVGYKDQSISPFDRVCQWVSDFLIT